MAKTETSLVEDTNSRPMMAGSRTRAGALLVLSLGVGAAVSIWLGQDANWDLKNYHLYNAFSVLAGRLDTDLLAAGLQSYFNPTLDLPYVLLAMGPLAEYPRVLAGYMGLWYGLLIWLALQLAARLLTPLPAVERRTGLVLGTLAAVTGAATVSQVGTTTNEIQVAVLILAGLLVLLLAVGPFEDRSECKPPWGLVLASGAVFGFAAGLKLTAAIFAPAACFALLGVTRPLRWVQLCAVFSMGWIVGMLPAFLWWGWMVWERFASPTFPLFNGVFRSPWYPPENFFDARFFPRDSWQWIFYPFYWAFRARHGLVAELSFRDPRLALAWLGVVAFALAWIAQRIRRRPPVAGRGSQLSPTQRVVLVFLVVSYVLWLTTSSILRYAVAMEVLAVLCLPAVIVYAARVLAGRSARRAAVAFMAGAFLVCLFVTKPMTWGRVPYGARVFAVDMAWTPPNTLFLAMTGPVAYLAAFVPDEAGAQFVGFSFTTLAAHGYRLFDETVRRVRAHTGPIVVLISEEVLSSLGQFSRIGVAVEAATCRSIASNLDPWPGSRPMACEAVRLPGVVPGAASQ